MKIFNKQPIDALVEITKGLMFKDGKLIDGYIPIYKEIMHEEEKDVPASYIVLRSKITDTTKQFGDGKSLIRTADCDIILVTKGYADDTTDLHNINIKKIEDKLKEQEINYQSFNLGYDAGIKSTQHTFSFEVVYIG